VVKLPVKPEWDRLRGLAPDLFILPAGTTVHRIYRPGGAHLTLWNAFRYFGPMAARFDHPEVDEAGNAYEQDRGMRYYAFDIPSALAEVFQEKRTVNRVMDRPWLVSLRLSCDLTLLNLTDTYCVRAGGSMKRVSCLALSVHRTDREPFMTAMQ
jgi:hypothetical protein